MNDHATETMGLDGPARGVIIRAAACALFVGMLLGIGASALGPSSSVNKESAPPTPYSADHARITETAAPIPTY